MADKRGDSGSESGSEEAVVGNLNKFAVVPPLFTGRPKKGHLIFDACFECGNLGRVDYITEFEYDLFIRPDTCNPRFRVWFNFTVENIKPEQRVIFNIVNFSKTKSLYREGMAPIVKSTSRPKCVLTHVKRRNEYPREWRQSALEIENNIQKYRAGWRCWQRIPSKNVYYYRCPDHRKNYVMSFAFCFDREGDTYQFAYCYPYSYTRMQTYLDTVEKRQLDYFKRELMCLSVQQRRLDLLTITNPDNLESDVKQRVVVITARVHPGETPASFVCQGLMDFLLSQHPIARVLRDHVVFKIVPILNPDGVYLGNYRCSLMGFDLNRHWHEPSPWAHPTLHATKNLLMEMDESNELDIDFYIDIHAHSTLTNGFMYGNVYDDPVRYEKQAVFPKLMCANADDFSMMNTSFNRDAVKAGTGRRFLGGLLDANSMCYTLEASFYCYNSSTSNTQIPYDEDGYMKLGRNLAKTFLDYYKLTSLITPKPTASPNMAALQSRKRRERSSKGRRSTASSSTTAAEEARSQSETRHYSTRNDVVYESGQSLSAQSMNNMVQFRLQHRDLQRH